VRMCDLLPCISFETINFHKSQLWNFEAPNISSRTAALGSTHLLSEMSTRNLPGGKRRPTYKVGLLTVICEPIVYNILGPPHFTTLQVSTAR
jgi:hypothetical protein